MKKILIIFLIVFIAIGCQDKKTIKIYIQKNGAITCETVDDILKKYVSSSLSENVVKNQIDYKNDSNDIYRLGFHIKLLNLNGNDEGYFTIGVLNYDLCSDGKIEYNPNRTRYEPFVSMLDNSKEKSIYITKRRLQERNLIAKTQDKQEDICIYMKLKHYFMSSIEAIESNVVVFTADEINNALAEYKALQ